ncbi:hypothetical protein D9611_011327 [Ephemerocybe angulata]|uniref:Cyclin N-terminal domain-containing protein n=1 Tax=Ephemerocybe angulata TaxID=980116 RepID=A0A8H5BDR4_9AGAR|nr:hypothetical protein D9611_011327 [Tulosesus angulatus]
MASELRLSTASQLLSSLDLDSIVEFDSMLESNSTPSQVQLASITSRLQVVSLRIAQLESRVQALDFQRRLIQGILSPIRRVPIEVLGEIFKMVVPYILGPVDRGMVGNMGRVCQRWRDALLNTPSVWRGLLIRPCRCRNLIPEELSRRHEADYRKIATWFGRAGGLSKVLVYGSEGTPCRCSLGGPCRSVHPIVAKLFQYGPQLDHMTLQVSSTTCLRNWVAQVGAPSGSLVGQTRWMSLQSLSLEFEDDIRQPWDDGLDPSTSVFTLLPPAVKRLGVHLPSFSTSFGDFIPSIGLPINVPNSILSGLVSLGVRWDWGGDRLAEVLSQCAVLECLSVDLSYSEPFGGESPTPPVVLASLKSFHLSMGGLSILDRFTMPSLTGLELELNVDRNESMDVSERLGRFIKTSAIQGTLSFLRICELVGGPGTVVLVLPPLPALKHLVLDSSLKEKYPGVRGSSGHRLFLAALIVADKFMNDESYDNAAWVDVARGYYPLRDIHQMEREMLGFLTWDLRVDGTMLQAFERALRAGFSRDMAQYASIPYTLICNRSNLAADSSPPRALSPRVAPSKKRGSNENTSRRSRRSKRLQSVLEGTSAGPSSRTRRKVKVEGGCTAGAISSVGASSSGASMSARVYATVVAAPH